MDIEKLILKLHQFERTILPFLKAHHDVTSLCAASGMKEIEVMRALQWLENKGALKIKSESRKIVLLDKYGEKYKVKGLPEKQFLKALSEPLTLSQLAKKAGLQTDEINAGLGLLKKKGAIDISKEKELMVAITPQGKKLIQETLPEEEFLHKKFPLFLLSLPGTERKIVEELRTRKGIISIDDEKTVIAALTDLGQKLVAADLGGEVLNRLTPELLATGKWKNKRFRAYDVEINVPAIHPGKKHFVNQAIDYIKSIWLEMGFTEMAGNYIQSAFWDLDALFVPQDHPAREMQDTFYLDGKAKLPELWQKIKKVHERGEGTNSTGWGYTFSQEETQQLLLRTHTTVLSARMLASLKKEDLPAKFFTVGKVFRNEALDWKHLFEFYQVEGIVVDQNATLSHLKGYLKAFYHKMGYNKIRMRPAHFPYTEPSLEIEVFHPVKKEWVELGGAGILRPEVVIPLLGFDCPVLAWGQGMERIIADYWQITDIRQLYNNDVQQLREMKLWLR